MPLSARAAALSFALGLCVTSAQAQDCKLKLLSSVALTQLGPGGRMTAPVSINGVEKHLLVDTAGGLSTLNPAAAEALNLHAVNTNRTRLLSGSGNASTHYVQIDDFQIGTLHGDVELMVSPDANMGANGSVDGVLAGDLLSRYDIEIDFAARKLNYFSPDHCEGKVVYWPAPVVAVVPITLGQPMRDTIPGERSRLPNILDSHIRVPVTLDGKSFTAVVNTGAPNSTMDAGIAKRVFGITADTPGSVPLGTAGNDPDHKIFGHIFGSMSFDGVAVSNPHVVIRPNLFGSKDPDNGVATGSNILRVDDGIGPEVTIGMDVLKNLHIYIAYKERKLYITPATTPAPAAAQP